MTVKRPQLLSTFIDALEIVFVSTGVFIAIYFLVGQLLEITGESMVPTFADKEQLVAEKISMNFKDLERGEVIIFKHPEQNEKLIIKRVIGLPGDTILIKNEHVYINDIMLEEPYLDKDTTTRGKRSIRNDVEYKIPENNYVVMGDNRLKSTDSRDWGFLEEDLIVGRGLLVYYPVSHFRIIQTPEYN